MDEPERIAVQGLFRLKSMIRDQVNEWEESAKRSPQASTRKWYLYMATELNNLLRSYDVQSSLDAQKGLKVESSDFERTLGHFKKKYST